MSHSERLTALDGTFLGLEQEGSHMHMGVVLMFEAAALMSDDGTLDIEHIRAFIASRLHRVPRYRQRLAWVPLYRQPVWIDDENFNVHYHVRHTSLPRPGDLRTLKRLVGRIMSQQLDRGKPLWELWIVEGLEDGRIAMIGKVHHCMVDGIAGADMLAELLSPVPDPTIEEAPRWLPDPAPTSGRLVVHEFLRRRVQSLGVLRHVGQALRDPGGMWQSVLAGAEAISEVVSAAFPPVSNSPINPSRISPHRRFDWVRFELDRAKEIRGRLGGTVNDVVLATVAGAMGRFLRRRGVRPEDLNFRALVPVSTRPDAERGRTGNRVALLFAQLPIGEADPRRRLERVIETTCTLKRSNQAHGTELIEAFGEWMGSSFLARTGQLGALVRAFNMVVTNIPGPSVPLYLLNARLLETYPLVPLYRNQAVGIALFSYRDHLHWGLNTDWDRVPDLHDLVTGLGAEFEALSKAAAKISVGS